MSKVKIESKFGQPFMLDTANVLSYVIVERDAEGHKLEQPFVAMLLSNGESINANLPAIGRALSRNVRWEHIRMIKGSSVTYVTATRTEGGKFTWRPSDTRELDATADGEYTSMIGIDVAPKYEDTLEGLPDYKATPDEDRKGDFESHEEGGAENGIPSGSKQVEEPILTNGTAKGKQK